MTDLSLEFVRSIVKDFTRHADKYDDGYASRLATVLAGQ